MQPQLIDYNKTSQELLINLINIDNPTTIDFSTIAISPPIDLGKGNTQIRLSPKPTSRLKGFVDLVYSRISLDQLFYGYQINIKTDEEVITHNFLTQYIKENFKINLNNEFDIKKEFFGEGYPIQYTLVAKDTSLVWIGELNIWILPVSHLSVVFPEDGLPYNKDFRVQNGFIYSVSKVFENLPSEFIGWLVKDYVFDTNSLENAPFLEYLRTSTGNDWHIADNIVEFNLHGAKVIYHGSLNSVTNEKVLCIQLSEQCSNLTGVLVIHYLDEPIIEEPDLVP